MGGLDSKSWPSLEWGCRRLGLTDNHLSLINTSMVAFRYQRRYTGPLAGVILDWAGTTMDYGCYAPERRLARGECP